MKFQEGDKIIVIATGDRGTVIEWINKKMLNIDVGGVIFPVYSDQIDFTYFQDFTTSNKTPKKKVSKTILQPKSEGTVKKTVEKDGVWISFFPILDKDVFDEDLVSHYKIFLMNHTDDQFIISFNTFYSQEKHLALKNTIRPFEDLYLIDLPFDKLNDHPFFQFIFTIDEKDQHISQELVFKIRPKQIFTMSEETLLKQKASFRFNLFKKFEGINVVQNPVNNEMEDKGIDLSDLVRAGFKITSKKSK